MHRGCRASGRELASAHGPAPDTAQRPGDPGHGCADPDDDCCRRAAAGQRRPRRCDGDHRPAGGARGDHRRRDDGGHGAGAVVCGRPGDRLVRAHGAVEGPYRRAPDGERPARCRARRVPSHALADHADGLPADRLAGRRRPRPEHRGEGPVPHPRHAAHGLGARILQARGAGSRTRTAAAGGAAAGCRRRAKGRPAGQRV